ncbi:hypothetical protein Pan44_25120 [Caulifigura coniformis]|uniref:Uncharacterized protein n=1 Tax=Caulifigura coniformis TaxID=2527983 RepID=A0A517SEC9_9PLAN|nr:hypothetical protein [Caulifigura coniformis]QDT54479.1 hypothetical protein Pan44_25120 [Caulifigura coniformis]
MSVTPADALKSIPVGLRNSLLHEYQQIVEHFQARKWLPTELSGGRFCEVVYTILDGRAKGTYPAKPSKPNGFPDACKRLENNVNEPRSFRILVPRVLVALYEIRNNRGVGHVGGDVDPNHMDSVVVVGMVDWVMAELIRVFHTLTTGEAQRVVDQIVERKIPLVWKGSGDVRRVLNTKLKAADQVLVLVYSNGNRSTLKELLVWTEYSNPHNFRQILRNLHRSRHLELSASGDVELLPPGIQAAEDLILDNK